MVKESSEKFLKRMGYTGKAKRQTDSEWRKSYGEKFGASPIPKACAEGWKASATATKSKFDSRWQRPYRDDEEAEAREADALKIAEARAKATAPAYNKGAYQPIGALDDLTTMGRKV